MINIFRKIRQNLLTENRFSKYAFYATGEITLVVIGILIALGINNWNQNRINTTKQHDYFNGLKNDLRIQILFFNSMDQFYDTIIDQGESILTDFNTLGKLSKIDSINKKLTSLMYSQKYPAITTTFNELNSTGQLNLIQKKTIRSQVIRYYQISDFYKTSIDGNTQNVFYSQLFPIIKSSVIIQQENFGFEKTKLNLIDNLNNAFRQNLEDSSKEFELINAISLRIILAKNNKSSIANAKKEAEQLLDLITNELNEP